MSKLKYWELVEEIKQLRREGHTKHAEQLLLKCLDAIDADGSCPPPWYFEQLAILHRKAGRTEQEISILKRYILACKKVGEPPIASIEARLAKAQTLAARQTG